MSEMINRVEVAARRAMEAQDKAHDWHHIERVRTMALRIAEKEGGDKELIELGALMHDVGDRKAHESEEAGHAATFALLAECEVPQDLADKVADIAHRVSFKGVGVADDMPTLEGQIVQDADRLDAIGAIAIARTFTWGGAKGRAMYDPDEPIVLAQNSEQYYNSHGASSIHHFHEKLLHLKDRIHTKTAREIAEHRHAFMERFLDEFMKEWEGKDL
ncbi:HD domain-containing protein [Candidatus Kaiserbacteria bacterium]|nr:HD domain-containing protein [Candidatus Kaiserbacteria bacterium]